ncbi:hypothetical protein D3C71_2165880 [compost metagenome]
MDHAIVQLGVDQAYLADGALTHRCPGGLYRLAEEITGSGRQKQSLLGREGRECLRRAMGHCRGFFAIDVLA